MAAAFMVASAVAAPVEAGRRWQDQAPSNAPQVEAQCDSFNSGSHVGMENSTPSSSQNRSGVSAWVNISATQFDICNNYILNAGPSAWIGIQPRTPTGLFPSTQIMQLGVIECGGGTFVSYCQGENNPHYVMAYGNCTGNFSGTIVDLGSAVSGDDATFSIYLMPDNYWHFSIDGTEEFVLHDNYVSCWTRQGTDGGFYHDGLRKAVWAGERFNPGDSLGGLATHERTYFQDARFGRYNLGWSSPGWTAGQACYVKTAPDDRCTVVNDDTFYVYTSY